MIESSRNVADDEILLAAEASYTRANFAPYLFRSKSKKGRFFGKQGAFSSSETLFLQQWQKMAPKNPYLRMCTNHKAAFT